MQYLYQNIFRSEITRSLMSWQNPNWTETYDSVEEN